MLQLTTWNQLRWLHWSRVKEKQPVNTQHMPKHFCCSNLLYSVTATPPQPHSQTGSWNLSLWRVLLNLRVWTPPLPKVWNASLRWLGQGPPLFSYRRCSPAGILFPPRPQSGNPPRHSRRGTEALQEEAVEQEIDVVDLIEEKGEIKKEKGRKQK